MAGFVLPTTVREAVERELRSLAEVDEVAARSSLAADALALAARIDDPGSSAAQVASCSRALLPVLEQLRLRGMPEKPVAGEGQDGGDRVDELGARRRARVAGARS